MLKRYTIKFQPLDHPLTTSQLKEEVERVLLRLHPRITYKMGEVFEGVDGKMRAEIAVDGKRELLSEAFASREWAIPVRFESLNWGWTVEHDEAALHLSVITPLDANPLMGIQPLDGQAQFPLSKWQSLGRYIILIVSTIILVLLLIANAIHTHLPVLEGIYFVGFAIWLFSLNETPFDYRVYARSISLRQDYIEVAYWLYREPKRLEWASIVGMEYANPVCEVFSPERKLRFLLSERFGCKEKSVVLKTIVKRASLSYVEGNFQKLSYRKPEGDNVI